MTIRNFREYCENYLKIKTKDNLVLPLVFNQPQEQLYKRILALNDGKRPLRWIVLKARQEGVSTFSEARIFFKTHTRENTSSLIVAHDRDGTNTILEMTKNFYRFLPDEVKPLTKHSNTKELVFMNPSPKKNLEEPGLNSSIRAQTAGWVDIGRSKTIHHLHCSEVAFWPDPETATDGLFEAVPYNFGTTIILESTANGVGTWFYNFWKEAKAGRGEFEAIFLPWFGNPEYSLPVPKGWRVSEEEEKLQKEHNLTLGQLAWYRLKLQSFEAKHPGKGMNKMKQEYPSTDEEAFIASGDSVFGDDMIEALYKTSKAPLKSIAVTKDRVYTDRKGDLKIWEYPEKGYEYAIGVDVGGGQKGDFSTIEVVRFPGYIQVAEWASDVTTPLNLSWIVKSIGLFYNNAIAAVEVNNHGILTNTELSRIYYRLYQQERFDRIEAKYTDTIGWNTTVNTKRLLVDLTTHLLYESECSVNSEDLISEMKTFTEEGQKYSAETGCHDDLVMAWMIALMAVDRKIARFSWDESESISRSNGDSHSEVIYRPWEHDYDFVREYQETDDWDFNE